MTTEASVDVVRRAYQAFNTADIALLTQLFDANSSWETPGRSSAAGLREGRDGVFAQFGRYGGETDGTFKADLRYLTADADGRVVGVHHNSGKRNGKTLDTMCCITFVVRNDRIMSGKEHFFDLYNWDAFWS